MILRAYKTKLRLTRNQKDYMYGCAGAARFVFNWALADRKTAYEERGETVNKFEQKRRFNAWKKLEAKWLYEYPYTLTEKEFDNVDKAYQNFFRRVKNGEKPGFPKFKNRHKSPKKFTLRGNIKVNNGQVKLPRIGWVKMAELDYVPELNCKLGNEGRILYVTISERVKNWFISFQIEEPDPEPEKLTSKVLGIDLGITSLAMTSDGACFNNPKTLKKYERKLARLQREMSRRKLGSKNRAKTRAKIAKMHRKIADIRKHTLHDISAHITKNTKPKAIVLEDLNINGMIKNRKLAKSIADASMSELKRQIDYKADWIGTEVLYADQWYPSTLTCSDCGNKKKKEDLTLNIRIYRCSKCGLEIDRDLNAAKNLAALYSEVNP